MVKRRNEFEIEEDCRNKIQVIDNQDEENVSELLNNKYK
jgi:hypothetical protein